MLSEKLYQLPSFKRQYKSVLALSVSKSIPELEWQNKENELKAQIDWNNLLGIASVFSFSKETEYLDAALRIAQTCLLSSGNETQHNASAVILENLTNDPAIKLAISRGLLNVEYKTQIPLLLQLQNIKTNVENSITIKDEILQINRFQKQVHLSVENNSTVSISAPTSAGKSFILGQLVIEALINSNCLIVYIVPTRALISQVENDFRDWFKNYKLENVTISTVPQAETLSGSNLLIFTQERLHWFLTNNPSLKIDILVIDESQKIGDSNRGILLQQKIEDVVEQNKNVKAFFSSPFTLNPEILYEDLKNAGSKETVQTEFVSVNQNLIYIEQVPRSVQKYKTELVIKEGTIELGSINLSDRPGASDLRKLAFITKAFASDQGGNIIYANGPAEAEDISLIFYSLFQQSVQSEAVLELIKLVKKTIHKDYSLAAVLEKGIAFHYGNMPVLIRQEIERLFKNGDIKYLVCTSTLLEGVNLPSKSIFIRKPTRGKGKPLSENDFWNLAGRAGRWGKEFSGNIVCIDPKKWDNKPKADKKKQVITRALDMVCKNGEELIQYLENNTPREEAEKRQDLEFAVGYYYIKFLKEELINLPQSLTRLGTTFSEIKKIISLPDYIIKRNPGISPIAQQSLLNYFQENPDKIESFIPVYPEDDNAFEEYTKLVGRIGKTIANYPPQINSARAVLLINWMKGRPLAFLIISSFKSYEKNEKYKGKKKLKTVIRETMDNVEQFVRFKFAKDSSCYIDVLRYFLERENRQDLVAKIPELNLWLEFGVSQKTHISLLALGLTRNTVVELSEFVPASQMSCRS